MTTPTIIKNLKKAAFDRETLTIGGGIFNHKEVAEFLGHYRAMQDALEAARVLCANLQNGGVGYTQE